MKKILFTIMSLLCLFILSACGKEEPKVETFTENYVAYVQINPSVKLNYSRACTKTGEVTSCGDPTVDSYELVNDDAKEIYKDIDLLADSKDLITVINKICNTAKEKGIEVKNVDIQSDWDELNIYIETEKIAAQNQQTQTEEPNEVNENNVDLNEVSFNVDVEEETQITTKIEEDVQEEVKAKEEAEKKAQEEAEAKAKAEAEKAAKEEATTIKLSDGVNYSHSGRAYCCEGCFTDALIKTLKNAKGYSVTSATDSIINIKYITKLTPDKYNTTTFKGSSLISKITNAGGEECGGLGGEAEPLTAAVCKEYHLKCK